MPGFEVCGMPVLDAFAVLIPVDDPDISMLEDILIPDMDMSAALRIEPPSM
jgi:hypothetical protein